MHGSTRSLALMRWSLTALAWNQWADALRAQHFWHRPLDMAWTSLFWVASPLLFLGLGTRTAAAVTGLVCLAHELVHVRAGGRPMREPFAADVGLLLAVAIVSLAFAPAGRSWSVDRWIALRRGRDLPEHADLWSMDLFRLLLGGFLAWTAVDLTSPAWLRGDRLHHWLRQFLLGSELPVPELLVQACAIGSTAAVAALAVAIWVPRTRAGAALAIALTALLLAPVLPIGVLPGTVATLALAVLPADVVHHVVDTLRGLPRDRRDIQPTSGVGSPEAP